MTVEAIAAQQKKKTDEAAAAQQQKDTEKAAAVQLQKETEEAADDDYGLNGGDDGSGSELDDVSVASKKRKWNTSAGAGIMAPNMMDYFYQQFIKDQEDKKPKPRKKGKTKSSLATKEADDSSSGNLCMLTLYANQL
jgi:hypothetical protein